MDGCENCTSLNFSYSIKTPEEFRQTIDSIHECLHEKTIKEIENRENKEILGIKPFDQISKDGPWNDFCSHYFQCTQCKKMFFLHVETYNGSGGKWEPFVLI